MKCSPCRNLVPLGDSVLDIYMSIWKNRAVVVDELLENFPAAKCSKELGQMNDEVGGAYQIDGVDPALVQNFLNVADN